MLIQEKVDQAKQLLEGLDIDYRITFVHESQLNGAEFLSNRQTEIILNG